MAQSVERRGHAKLKSDLIADLYANLPPARAPQLTVDAPA